MTTHSTAESSRPVRRVRFVDLRDLDDLVVLASGTEGHMTTMPRDPEHMARRVDDAVASVDPDRKLDGREVYFFVLDEGGPTEPEVTGTAAIYAAVGLDRPFYNFRVSRLTKYSPEIDRRFDYTVLQPSSDYTGCTEVGTLYLPPEHRGGGRGRLLSFARFLFLAVHRSRFGEIVVAEMRGWIDDDGNSPFWDAVGQKFFGMELGEADRLSGQEFRFMQDLLPGTPIPVDLLPDAERDVISQPHAGSEPAAAMLRKIGLRDHGYIDIFDAGLCLDAPIDDVDVTRRLVRRTVAVSEESPTGQAGLACNSGLADFAVIELTIAADDVQPMTAAQAEALGVTDGDTVGTYTFEPADD